METIDIRIGKIGIADALPPELPENLVALLIAEPFLREIDLKKEVTGLTSFAADTAQQTLACDYPVFCGCRTAYHSVRHLSVLAFSKGRLADIADRTFNLDGSNYAQGDSIKVYTCGSLRLGLLVDTDILLAQNWKRLSGRVDAVIGLALRSVDADFAYLPTLSSLFGIPYVAAFADGSVLWGTTEKE